jgi:hypothetical protein
MKRLFLVFLASICTVELAQATGCEDHKKDADCWTANCMWCEAFSGMQAQCLSKDKKCANEKKGTCAKDKTCS